MQAEVTVLLDLIPAAAAQIQLETHHFLQVNQPLAAMTGYTVEELLGMMVLDLTHPDDQVTCRAQWAQIAQGAVPSFALEKRCLRKEGAPLWVHTTVSLIGNQPGAPKSAIVVMQESRTKAESGDLSHQVQAWQAIALDAAKICVWEMDVATQQSAQPDNLARVVGFALPHHFPDTFRYIHEDDWAPVNKAMAATIATGEPFHLEFRMVNPANGAIVWLRAQGNLVQNHQDQPPHLVGIVQNITEHKQMAAALQESYAHLESRVLERTAQLVAMNETLRQEIAERQRVENARQQLLRQLVRAQEDERRRIARDLHDSLGQHLAALHFGLKAAQETRHCPADLRASIQQLRDQALRIDDAVERLTVALRPPALDDLGLVDVLHGHAQEWQSASGIPVDLHVRGLTAERLPTEIETTIYRIVQEALTNILRHAAATHVSLIVERRADEALVIIEDNGQGFDWEALQQTPHTRRVLGLQGMIERATLAGGRIEIETAPGAGTTIFLHLPVQLGNPMIG